MTFGNIYVVSHILPSVARHFILCEGDKEDIGPFETYYP